VLGRDLRLEEALYVTDLIRRLAALVALQPALDASYAAARDQAWRPNMNDCAGVQRAFKS